MDVLYFQKFGKNILGGWRLIFLLHVIVHIFECFVLLKLSSVNYDACPLLSIPSAISLVQ